MPDSSRRLINSGAWCALSAGAIKRVCSMAVPIVGFFSGPNLEASRPGQISPKNDFLCDSLGIFSHAVESNARIRFVWPATYYKNEEFPDVRYRHRQRRTYADGWFSRQPVEHCCG